MRLGQPLFRTGSRARPMGRVSEVTYPAGGGYALPGLTRRHMEARLHVEA